MEVGLVRKIDIDQEMQQAYLDYAMSVIVARALPDARDGLKPVHRRILYAMHDMGLRTDSSYKKSARIVGEVLGKYHPHGDAAVYESMARMAQDFSMRYMLVDGQGNFGSVDGDPPAAMRYTEARMHALATNMLADINKNTVDFDDNFDGTLTEPSVLPAAIPNLLINGATGIAVGMSTSIPPHNLVEVVQALHHMLDNWDKMDDIGLEDLMQFIHGPDFPTGGIIIHDPQGDSLASAYGSGRGRITVQARAHLEEMDRGRTRIIVTELPYMTNKAGLIERIASLVRDERLDGIVDLRDESDRQGMRVVIELSRGADPEKTLRDLYKSTPMQGTFSIIMLALVDGEPRMLSLKQSLRVYLEHRMEIVRRRSQYDLERARARAHILEGLRVALKNLDEVIDLIRKAPDVEAARTRLMKRFKLTDVQAQAILDMQLRRLASLERKKIDEEYKETLAHIKELEELLRSPKKMRALIAGELAAVSETYGDRRRTQIVGLQEGEQKFSLLTTSDLTPEQTVWVSLSPAGTISRSLSAPENARSAVKASSRDILYLVCEAGEAAAIAMHAVPEFTPGGNGVPIHRISPLREGQKVVGLFTAPNSDRPADRYILTTTRQGMMKKSPLSDLPGASANAFTLVRVNEGDQLGWLGISDGSREVLLASGLGMGIRFKEEEIRSMGLAAAGVMGIKLHASDEVIGMALLPQAGDLFLATSEGGAKRVALADFPLQGRYGQGVIAWKQTGGARLVGLAVGAAKDSLTLLLESGASKMVRFADAPLAGRAAKGGSLKSLKKGERLAGLGAVIGAAEKTAETVKKAGLAGKKPAADGRAAAKKAGLTAPDGKSAAKKQAAANKPAAAPKRASTRAAPGTAKAAVAKQPAAKKAAVAKSAPAKSAPSAQKTTGTKQPTPKKTAAPGTKTAPAATKSGTAKQLGFDAITAAPGEKQPARGKPAAQKPAAAKKPSAAKKPASKAEKPAAPAKKPTAKAAPADSPGAKKPAASSKTGSKKPPAK